MNEIDASSLTKLLNHYTKNPLLLTTKDLISIQEQKPEFSNIIFLSAVGANNQEYFEKIIKRMPDKITSFTDSEGRGIYHYVSLGGYKHLDTFFKSNSDENKEIKYKSNGKAVGFNPVSFFNEYPYCLQHNGKSPFFDACNAGDSENVQFSIEKHPQLIDRKDENNKNIFDHYLEQPQLLSTTALLFIQEERPKLIDTVFVCAVTNNNKQYVRETINKNKMNSLKLVSIHKLFDHYLENPSFLETKHLINICQQRPDFIDRAFLTAVGVDNKQAVNQMIKQNIHEKVSSFTDPKHQGIYHYMALGGFEYFDMIFGADSDNKEQKNDDEKLDFSNRKVFKYESDFDNDEAIGFNPFLFYENYPFCLGQNGKSPFFESLRYGDPNNIEKLIKKYPELLDTKDENDNNILDYDIKRSLKEYIYTIRPNLTDKDGYMYTSIGKLTIDHMKRLKENNMESSAIHQTDLKMETTTNEQETKEKEEEQDDGFVNHNEQNQLTYNIEEIMDKKQYFLNNNHPKHEYQLVQLTQSLNND